MYDAAVFERQKGQQKRRGTASWELADTDYIRVFILQAAHRQPISGQIFKLAAGRRSVGPQNTPHTHQVMPSRIMILHSLGHYLIFPLTSSAHNLQSVLPAGRNPRRLGLSLDSGRTHPRRPQLQDTSYQHGHTPHTQPHTLHTATFNSQESQPTWLGPPAQLSAALQGCSQSPVAFDKDALVVQLIQPP